MAQVTATGRGQLILVGGIVVALALVALALLLNSALFTENIATRGLGPETDRASDMAEFARRAGGRVLAAETAVEYERWMAAEANASMNLAAVAAVTESLRLRENGGLATVDRNDTRRGAALVQTNGTRNFTAAGSDGNWTLANTTGLRSFRTTVNTSALSLPDPTGAFVLRIEGSGGAVWTARIYENDGDVEVNASGTVCRSSGQQPTINWTGKTFGDCSFPFAVDAGGQALAAPYNVSFRNGSRAAGTYRLIASNNSSDVVHVENFAGPGADASPRRYHAVYSVVLAVGYQEGAVDYSTLVRIAPGEPAQTSPD